MVALIFLSEVGITIAGSAGDTPEVSVPPVGAITTVLIELNPVPAVMDPIAVHAAAEAGYV